MPVPGERALRELAPDPAAVEWEALSPECSEILETIALRHALGFSYEEIAAQLGISKNQVSERMHRLRADILRVSS